ncbi:1849_t:CDS:2 [Entrophospora sp. SA101]|nr:1849_t:CDS:2 [Entrophospora sp. SA101]
MSICSYSLSTKPIFRFIQSNSQSLTAFVHTDGTIEVHSTKVTTCSFTPLRIDDDPTHLLLLDIPTNSLNEPIINLVITFYVQSKEKNSNFDLKAYEFLPTTDNNNTANNNNIVNNIHSNLLSTSITSTNTTTNNNNGGVGLNGVGNNNYTEFNLIPIALQVGDERFLKDFKSSSKYKLSASVHSCPKYITGFGQKVIMLCESNEIVIWHLRKVLLITNQHSKSKQMGSFIGIVTIKQLISGKLCSCYNLQLVSPDTILLHTTKPSLYLISASIKSISVPITIKSRKASLDEPTSEIRHHTVIACFPLKQFSIPDLSSSRSYPFNESQSQKPKQQQRLSITLFENFMINEKIDKDLLLMICWINMPLLNDVDGSNTGLYIVRFEEEDIKLLKSLCDLANLLSFVNKNKNISVKAVGDKTLLWQSINCHLFHGIFSPNHIMDVCTQNQDVMMVATTKETLMYVGDWL